MFETEIQAAVTESEGAPFTIEAVELVTSFDFDEIQEAVEASEDESAIKPILRVSEP